MFLISPKLELIPLILTGMPQKNTLQRKLFSISNEILHTDQDRTMSPECFLGVKRFTF